MLTEEGALLAELLDGAVEVDRLVGKFASSLARIAQHGTETAVDVDAGIAGGGSGVPGELVELLLACHQRQAQLFEQGCALVERQGSERWTADGAGVVDHAGDVEAAGRHPGDLAAVDGAQQRRSLVRRGIPRALGIAFQKSAHNASISPYVRSVITIAVGRLDVKTRHRTRLFTIGADRRKAAHGRRC
ncbi:unannotated protein [freshwater metagenome]|uniref:Unannotated protein n=1 Tax=freshwater metagenome TaxID=449393 RepID=A0A6J7IIC1_9ZZZZ